MQLLALSVLALLIGDTAAGLASRLAGSLALAATAILRTLAQIAGLNGLDMLHNSNLHIKLLINVTIFPHQSQHARKFIQSFLICSPKKIIGRSLIKIRQLD